MRPSLSLRFPAKFVAALTLASVLILAPLSTSSGNIALNAAQAQAANATVGASASTTQLPQTCTGVGGWIDPTCWLRFGVNLFSTMLITVARFFLVATGLLFDWLIEHTIIKFADFYGIVKGGVEAAWTAFRDIANILIIGIFTFIAIGTILGLESFNVKKLIARVLLIAIFINFSLLGAKMIIDGSNFLATQIYVAAKLGNGTDATASTAASQVGIAEQFTYLLGVSTLGDTYSAVRNISNTTDSAGIAFLHAIFVTIVLFGITAVLLYGSFLMVSRALLIIFIFLTASIAFASYLVPKWGGSGYGWSTWWSSLLKSAVFAPALMFFLWVTLTVAYSMRQQVGGTLGDMVANPTSIPNINSLFVYIMILGMLFISFKLTSTLAGKIAGLNIAHIPSAIVSGWGMRLGSIPLKYGAGYAAARGAKALQGAAEKAGRNGNFGLADRLDRAAGRLKAPQKRDYNLANTAIGKAFRAPASVKSTLAGQTKGGGYEKYAEEQAKHAAELASKIAYSKEDKAKFAKTALEEARAAHKPEMDAIEERKRLAQEEKRERVKKRDEEKEHIKQQKELGEQNIKALKEQREQSANDFKKQSESLDAERKGAEEARRNAMAEQAVGRAGADVKLTDANKKLEQIKITKEELENRAKIELKAHDDAIDHIATNLNTLRESELEAMREHERLIAESTENIKQVNAQAAADMKALNERIAADAEARIPKAAKMSRGDIAAEVANQRLTNVLARAAGLGHPVETDIIAGRASKLAGKKEKTEGLETLIKDMQDTGKPSEPAKEGGDK